MGSKGRDEASLLFSRLAVPEPTCHCCLRLEKQWGYIRLLVVASGMWMSSSGSKKRDTKQRKNRYRLQAHVCKPGRVSSLNLSKAYGADNPSKQKIDTTKLLLLIKSMLVTVAEYTLTAAACYRHEDTPWIHLSKPCPNSLFKRHWNFCWFDTWEK